MAEEKDMQNDGMERKDIEEYTTCTGSITFNTRRRHGRIMHALLNKVGDWGEL